MDLFCYVRLIESLNCQNLAQMVDKRKMVEICRNGNLWGIWDKHLNASDLLKSCHLMWPTVCASWCLHILVCNVQRYIVRSGKVQLVWVECFWVQWMWKVIIAQWWGVLDSFMTLVCELSLPNRGWSIALPHWYKQQSRRRKDFLNS